MESEKMAVDSPKLETSRSTPQPTSSAPRSPRNPSTSVLPQTEPPLAHIQDRISSPRPETAEPLPQSEDKMDIATPRAGTPAAAGPSRPVSSSLLLATQADEKPPPQPSQKSRRPSPMEPHSHSTSDRPLNVTDALSYLDAVKNQFSELPDVYNQFLDIMKEFKNEQIDTPGVIQRVSYLFNGHPALIQGFNTFLPAGYRIECSADGHEAGFITVTTPTGTTTQSTHGPPRQSQWQTGPGGPRPPPLGGYGGNSDHIPAPGSPDPLHPYTMEGQAMEPAVQYVQKIKQRCDADTYRQFLDILARYHNAPDSIDEEEVSRQVARLFKNDPDLRADFRVFMPSRSQQFFDEAAAQPSPPEKSRRKLDTIASSMNTPSSLPQKRKRKPAEKEREREKEREKEVVVKQAPPPKKSKPAPIQDLTPVSYNPKHIAVAPSSPRRNSHQQLPLPGPPPPQPARMQMPSEDAEFFERVRRAIGDHNIYNEFLKIVNLFAQDYIDTARLVKESRNFLGDTELFRQFCDILGWDEKKDRESYLAELNSQSSWTKPAQASLPERPGRIDLSEKYGSYRRVSASEANVSCSGRDEMCRSVLNDEWVSHPTWTSEDSGFIAHKKNIYEEALHRSEEERHEYDFHIDAIVRTISLLEPLNNRIAGMNNDDRANFKLKHNLGGSLKAIHQRVIKKIYGREAGLEVIQAMHETPAVAIPVVLTRLKQKEEEWKRAQREWNKVWREVDARNYAKSLDHQSITFKTTDKKAITTKSFVNQIETARSEQVAARASLIDPLFARTRPRYQLAFVMDDEEVLQTVIKLTMSFTDRTQGQISAIERKRVENFLRTFIPLFFCLNSVDFNLSIKFLSAVESDGSDIDVGSTADDNDAPSSSTSTGRGRGRKNANNGHSGGDLRKKLLKSEQAKSTSRKTRGHENNSPAVSRFASPSFVDDIDKGQFVAPAKRSSKFNNIFFTNTTFYSLLRLIQLMYSRLELFKSLSAKLADSKKDDKEASANGVVGPAEPTSRNGIDGNAQSHANYYEWMIDMIEDLFDNQIEQSVFEDRMRKTFGTKHAYNIFTVDKVLGAIVKQVQAIISEPKSQDLLENLKRERSLPNPSTQDHLNIRRNAEKVLGPDENVFRIDWLSESKMITFQLIGKDDANLDDSEILTGRWQSYVDAYVSNEATDGSFQVKMKRPYLKKNLPPAVRESQPDILSQDGLEIKVCVRTYRLFYVPNTEDLMWKFRSKEDMESYSRHLKQRNASRRAWLETAKSS